MHKIPNVPLGKVQQRHVVRIFFPRLYSTAQLEGDVHVSQEDLALIYDRCLRPTLLEVVPEFRDRLPTSYAAALTYSKTCRGGLAFGSLDIPWDRLERVAEILLAKLGEQKSTFKDAYFVHELRGTKGSTMHDGEDDVERDFALQDMFEHVDVSSLDPQDWLVDVALTIGVEGHVVTWRESCHQELLSHLMPAAPPQKISSLTTRKNNKFHLDRTLQIKELAGFRATTTDLADDVSYVQAYCTEKNVSYQLNPGVFRRRKPEELLDKKKEQKVLADLDLISQVYYECAGEEEGVDGRDGCARLEIRVPLNKAMDALSTLPEELVERTVVAINRRVWW
ncbi:hypothetical protein EV702DRAFT_1182517 [Suillus placidus]|uniref:Uncharacterized protein n=1 Tax=Suillus placidus TaxID=48579 RepID=A0A9P7CWA0_9AGAM|nr:hypothetical protein EV702DRAFT_1182517 [Suillus placidus]